MNVLMVRTDYKMAGPGILTLKYSNALKKEGHHIIACSSGGALIKEFEKKGIKHYQIDNLAINKRSAVDMIKAIKELKKIIKENDIDIIHGQNAVSTMLSWIASITCRRKIKVFNTVHGVGKESFLKVVPCKIIAVSNHVKNNLMRHGINEERIKVLYNGVIDTEEFDISKVNINEVREELGIDKSDIVVGCIAMFTGKKGHIDIIRSIPSIIKNNENIKFIFIGDGPKLEECKQEVKRLNIGRFVVFTGVRNDIPNICASIDILMHLPEYETFGIVLTEAMAMGKPIISRNVGGIPEVVRNGENGILINEVNNENIVSSLSKIINNYDLRLRYGQNSLKIVQDNFTIEKTIKNLVEIYNA